MYFRTTTKICWLKSKPTTQATQYAMQPPLRSLATFFLQANAGNVNHNHSGSHNVLLQQGQTVIHILSLVYDDHGFVHWDNPCVERDQLLVRVVDSRQRADDRAARIREL